MFWKYYYFKMHLEECPFYGDTTLQGQIWVCFGASGTNKMHCVKVFLSLCDWNKGAELFNYIAYIQKFTERYPRFFCCWSLISKYWKQWICIAAPMVASWLRERNLSRNCFISIDIECSCWLLKKSFWYIWAPGFRKRELFNMGNLSKLFVSPVKPHLVQVKRSWK